MNKIEQESVENAWTAGDRESVVELLRLLNSPAKDRELMQLVTGFMRNWSGCHAVGVRLQEGDDFPYFETRGFPEEFVLAENSLCEVDEQGELVRDRECQPVLECMCGNIIRGRFDASKPFFTANGSFWTNSTSELLASTNDADRQGRTRNRCNGEGYESVALIPLRSGEETFGLLQFNDKRRGGFTPELISLLEGLAESLAMALAQRRAEEALRRSNARLTHILAVSPAVIYACEAARGYRPTFVSDNVRQLLGYEPQECLGQTGWWANRIHPDDRVEFSRQLARLVENGRLVQEYRFQRKDGTFIWVRDEAMLVQDQEGNPTRDMVGSLIDVTDRRQIEQVIERQLEAEMTASEETRKRLVESRSLQRVTAALLQKLTVDEVLEIVCAEAAHLTGATGCAVLLKGEEGRLRVTKSTGKPALTSHCSHLEGCLAALAARKGEPMMVNSPGAEARACRHHPQIQALLSVPLHVEGTVMGVLHVVNRPGGFTEDNTRIMSLFADQAAIAIQTAGLHEIAEQVAVIEERQRLARELHDSVAQALYTVSLYADAARMALSAGKEEVAVEHLEELRSTAREAMLDMRLLIFELRPPALERDGLTGALQTRLAAVEARAGLQTEIRVEGDARLSLALEEELYRVSQEALNNVVRHAEAQNVTVDVELQAERVRLEVRDDGVGFDPAVARKGGGMGLRTMQERIQRLGGQLTIDSAPGEGTALRVDVEVEI